MTLAEVILAGFPQADDAMVEHILWTRTPYPMGKVTARSLYRAASRFRRAVDHGVQLCEFCDNKAASGKWECDRCRIALEAVDTVKAPT